MQSAAKFLPSKNMLLKFLDVPVAIQEMKLNREPVTPSYIWNMQSQNVLDASQCKAGVVAAHCYLLEYARWVFAG